MHTKDTKFYKYLGPDSSLAVLKNKTLKWSNPKLFNDPFDLPTEMDFPFDGKKLAEALLDEVTGLVYGDEEPKGNIQHPLFLISLLSRKISNNQDKESFREFMAPALIEIANRFIKEQGELRTFYKNFRENFAILCVSKKYDDLLMWAHYANDHTGCVLKLQCLPEKDRPLCVAQEVQYKDEYPTIAKLDDYVKNLTGQIELNYEQLFSKFAFTKSKCWSYEEEWRCISLLNNHDAGYDFDPLIPEEVEAVYLGCRIAEPTKNSIMEVIKNEYSNTAIYQSKINIQHYSLTFEQIS